MKKITLKINGKVVKSEEGSTILEAATQAGIHIPSLCYNDKLKPQGACRLCMVEITKGKRKQLVVSCGYPVQEGLIVETNSEKIIKIRRMIIELLWPSVQDLAKEYNVKKSRFTHELTDCTLCGLCVRYCAEIKKANVVYFKGRGINREIAFVPELENKCLDCLECIGLCTGGLLDCKRIGQSKDVS